jgi:PKD repeat protein
METTRFRTRVTLVVVPLVAVMTAACGLDSQAPPPLIGPSGLGSGVTVTASPDQLPRDGSSQSVVTVTSRDPNNRPVAGQRLTVVVVGGSASQESVTTNSDGRATFAVTAPGQTVIVPGNQIVVSVTPVGENADNALPRRISIALTGTPNSTAPVPSFTVTPQAPEIKQVATFDATETTDEGGSCLDVCTYAWNFDDGSTASGRVVTHTFTIVRNYTVTLDVSDASGVTVSLRKVVGVTPRSTIPPTANFTFSPGAPAPNQSVFFNAAISTAAAGHTLTSFAWDFGDGATATGQSPSHSYSAAGTFTVTLTVTDDVGEIGVTSKTVAISTVPVPPGTSPIADFVFSPTSPQINQSVFFDASSSRAGSGHRIASFNWSFGDGGNATNSAPTATHSYAAAATYNAVLTVTDEVGATSIIVKQVTVSAVAGSLTADFTMSPTNPISGSQVSFNANTSTPLTSITTFDWDFGDGTIINNQTTFLINHAYFTPVDATYTIRLTVHDNTGRIATTTKTLSVKPGSDPTAAFTISPSPATVGAVVTFDGAPSTAVGPATKARYEWDFGDGSAIVSTVAPTSSVTHSYSATGTYTIRLTVFDTNGRSNSTTHTLLVQ